MVYSEPNLCNSFLKWPNWSIFGGMLKTSYLGPIYGVKWVLGPLGAFGDIKKKIPISSDFFPVILGPVVLVLSQFFQFSKFLDFQIP